MKKAQKKQEARLEPPRHCPLPLCPYCLPGCCSIPLLCPHQKKIYPAYLLRSISLLAALYTPTACLLRSISPLPACCALCPYCPLAALYAPTCCALCPYCLLVSKPYYSIARTDSHCEMMRLSAIVLVSCLCVVQSELPSDHGEETTLPDGAF
jgi:hypothetical protein